MTIDSPQVMGILNVTPDSFSDGGNSFEREQALSHALQMYEEGAAIIDVGGESSRPGAKSISVQEELDRVIPIIEGIRSRCEVLISIDTCKVEVMREAVKAGAGFINDINALRGPGTLEFVATTEVPVCFMHMQGEPASMQNNPFYANVVSEVLEFLQMRINIALQAGINRNRIFVDPGFGFGKNLQHNLQLLQALDLMRETLDVSLLVGLSRKAMIGHILKVEPNQRLYGSLALAVWAMMKGVRIIRAHDVRPTVDVITIIKRVMEEGR